jgi:DNA-binding beta-propeller fold protein YncE
VTTAPTGQRRKAFTSGAFLLVSALCLWTTGSPAEDAAKPSQTAVQLQPLFAFFQHTYHGYFNEPMGVFYDPRRQEIYVADTKNDLIGIFDPQGNPLFAFGARDDIKEPMNIVADPGGRLLLLDIDKSKVKIYSYRGEFLRDFIPAELPEKRLITAMTIDMDGNLYIGDSVTSQVLVYDPGFRLKRKFGSKGRENGQFEAIGHIATDRSGKIYVTDPSGIPVQVFDRNGNFLRGWGKHETGVMNFSLPAGIAVDSKGRVIVLDTLRQEIKFFDADGNFLMRAGGFGSRPGEVAFPIAVAVDSADRIYVVEKVGGRVQVFQEVETPVPPEKPGS